MDSFDNNHKELEDGLRDEEATIEEYYATLPQRLENLINRFEVNQGHPIFQEVNEHVLPSIIASKKNFEEYFKEVNCDLADLEKFGIVKVTLDEETGLIAILNYNVAGYTRINISRPAGITIYQEGIGYIQLHDLLPTQFTLIESDSNSLDITYKYIYFEPIHSLGLAQNGAHSIYNFTSRNRAIAGSLAGILEELIHSKQGISEKLSRDPIKVFQLEKEAKVAVFKLLKKFRSNGLDITPGLSEGQLVTMIEISLLRKSPQLISLDYPLVGDFYDDFESAETKERRIRIVKKHYTEEELREVLGPTSIEEHSELYKNDAEIRDKFVQMRAHYEKSVNRIEAKIKIESVRRFDLQEKDRW
ncbi:MAG: hypothetical protein Q9M91_06555 [Candidatus Dojkabacteria bacterium]|nr:hypothetical protein [Candidatus Dojkabacteria bacterium]MDQ7021457.1 hypothetical protein [Candidatus Dojkabacteria bacterium]